MVVNTAHQRAAVSTTSINPTCLVTSTVYERLWGQGEIFRDEWRKHGFCELSPVPSRFQPKVHDLVRKWDKHMTDYATLATTTSVLPTSRGAIAAPRCPATTLAELRTLKPLSKEPLVYLVPHFLSDAECDYLACLGAYRCRASQPLLSCVPLTFS